jgi:hypothetical protein
VLHDDAQQAATDAKETDVDRLYTSDLNTDAGPQPGAARKSWRETFRLAFDQARKQQRTRDTRQELAQDRTKSLLVLLAVTVLLLLLFLGLFSSSNKSLRFPGDKSHAPARLGRRLNSNQQSTGTAVAPMLSADVRANDPATQGQVTAQDIERTSRTGTRTQRAKTSSEPQEYALSRIDFSDPSQGRNTTPASTAASARAGEEADQKKPSLVFVRSSQAKPGFRTVGLEGEEETVALPAGTRLLARLQAPVCSAVRTPVVAVVEYNYEHDGQIIVPAGAKVLGSLVQANPSGDVLIQFSRLELPDGTSEKLDASAMDLSYKPLRGYVSGKNTGGKFLVRSLTGLGTVASYLAGPQASASSGLISTNVLLRERLAENVGTAGQEQLNALAYNRNLVVTVPANTRFYVVLEKPTSDRSGINSSDRNTLLSTAGASENVPTLEELRQLMQLRREISELYTASSGSAAAPEQQ